MIKRDRDIPLHTPPALRATPRRAGVALAWLTGFVAALGIAGSICKFGLGIEHGPIDIIALLDFAGEQNLPSWYSSALLLVAGMLLGAIGWLKVVRRERFSRHWLVLGLIFVVLSIDESISIHERAAWPMERVFKLKGAFLYGWVIPALVIVSVIGLSYLKFLIHLPARTRWRFVAAGAIYVGGALGLEMVEGVYETRFGSANGVYAAIVAAEEIMEMAGVALFIYAMLAYARDEWSAVTFRLVPAADASRVEELINRIVTTDPPGSSLPGPAATPARAYPDHVGV